MIELSTQKTMRQTPNLGTVGRLRWAILGLLFGAAFINYADRFLLGVLKVTIVQDLQWSETDYANVVFCFQLAYAIGLTVVSRFVDKVGVRKGLSLVVLTSAIAAASHSFAVSVIGFCIARFALGFAESGTWPCCVKAVQEWFPSKERAIGTGVVNAGSSIAATIAPLLVPLILKLVSWPFAFLFTAALDLFWLCAWLVGYRSPEHHPRLKNEELTYIRGGLSLGDGKVSWWRLFVYRQTWAFAIAKGLTDPIWWFYLFWVPGFLAKEYNLATKSAVDTTGAVAVPVMVIYVLADLGSVTGGWLSMKLINLGWSVNAARKTVMLGCACCVIPVCLVPFHIGLWPSALLIGLAAASHLAFSANLFAVATDTVPKQAVGSVVGIGGLVAAVAAMLMSKFVGYVLDSTHSYIVLFVIASGAYCVALAFLHVLLPRLESMRIDQRV